MRKKVCICSFEIDGPGRGGIGTAYASLAEVLAAAGHEVTLVLAADECRYGSPKEWETHFGARGVRFEVLPALGQPVGPVEAPWQVQLSYRAHLYLKARAFDVVHFPEVLGVGYFSLLARQQGLAHQETTLCVGVHGPSQWVREANRSVPLIPPMSALAMDYLERRCVELAPVLVSPSAYMFRWLEESGWTLGSNRHVLPNVLRPSRPPAADAGEPSRVAEELVFFGRLEGRKGLVLFCDAIDLLLAGRPAPRQITFLGWAAKEPIEGTPAPEWIRRRVRNWSVNVSYLDDLGPEGALAYLRGPGRLAVMPSEAVENSPYTVLECLGAHVAFVTTDVGGISELVAPSDRARVCLDPSPESLAAGLAEACGTGIAPARPAISPEDARAAWLSWHAAASAVGTAPVRPPPRVTLIVTGSGATATGIDASVETIRVDAASPGARARAVERAAGEYVLFASATTGLKARALERFVTAARHSDADVFTCFSETIAEGRTLLGLFAGGPASAGLATNPFGDAHAFFRRGALLKLGGPGDDEGDSPDDRATLARAALAGLKLEVVPEILIEHRGTRPRRSELPADLARAYRRALPAALQDMPAAFHVLAINSRTASIARNTAREMREAPGGRMLLGDTTANLANGPEAAVFVRSVLRSPAWQLLGPVRALVLAWRRLTGSRP